MISTFTAFIDSNVFYGARLRSLILYLAQTGLFRARWSDAVHDEWISKLCENRPDLEPRKLRRTRELMDAAVPDCLVTGYEPLVSALQLPDPNDRHILAAAIRGAASTIITFNEKDFPDAILDPYGIHVRHPDDFILDVVEIHDQQCIAAVREDIAHYVVEPLTVDEYLESLENAGVPKTAEYLREIKVMLT